MMDPENPCYLVDGQGMELLLRRQHPTSSARAGGTWRHLLERPAMPGAVAGELCLFGLPSSHPLSAHAGPGSLRLILVPELLEEFAPWLKRDARKRTTPCWYCLVSDDPELRRQAGDLGIAILDPDGLLRRLGLASSQRHSSSADAMPERPLREPAVIKGGKAMSREELAWWSAQLELDPEDAGVDGGQEPGTETMAQDGSSLDGAGLDPEDIRFARLMGAQPGDPRVLGHDDEEWLARQFPSDKDDPHAHRPRGPAKPRRR